MPSKITFWQRIRGLASGRILGRITSGTGGAEELTGTNVRTIVNVAGSTVVLSDADATLTAAQLVDNGVFTIAPSTPRTLTTDDAVNIIAAITGYQVGSWFDFTVVNTEAFDVTLAGGTGVTIVGETITNSGSGTWRIKVDSASAVTIYTLAAIETGVTGVGASTLHGMSDVDDALAYTAGFVLQADGTQYSGSQLAHSALSGVGTNSHTVIDAHIDSDTTVHAAATNLLHTTGNETKTAGILTFAELPQSSVTPLVGDDFVNKTYVDTFAAGLSIRRAVDVATTANITLSGEQTIDGVLTSASRVLVKNQTTQTQNGIYVSSSGAWSRASDSDTSAEVGSGSFTLVLDGSTNVNKQFVQTTDSPTLGSSNLIYTQLSAPTVYTGSLGVQLVGSDFRANFTTNDGLKLTSNELTVAYDNSSIGIVSNLLAVKSGGVTNAMLAGSIADTKLSQITTAGTVSGSAITSLASLPSGAGYVPAANLGSGSPSATTYLRGDQTYAVPDGLGAGVVTLAYTKMQDTSSSNVTVTNTATETTIYTYSVPANTLGTNRALRFTLNGTYFNNSTANRTVTVRVKYGATTILTKVSPTIPSNATTGSFAIEGFIAAQNSASIQTGYMWVSFEGGDDITRWVDDKGSAAEDSTGALNLVVTVQLSAATATQTIVQRFATLELLNASDTIGSPSDAQYVVLAANGNLSNERVLTGTADQIIITDGGAGNPVTLSTPQSIGTTATPTFGAITLGVASTTQGLITLYGSGGANAHTFRAAANPAAANTYVWPSADPAAATVLTASAPSAGVVTLTWVACMDLGSSQTVTAAKAFTGKVTFGATVKTPQTYTPAVSATATLDCSLGDIHRITMPAGDITIALSNITDGQSIQIAITQDGGGSRLVTWFSTIRWAGGVAPTLTTTGGQRDMIVITCTGTGTYDGFVAGANI